MTAKEAKIYIEYVKVLMKIHNCGDEKISEALDMADKALGHEPAIPDPRFP